MDEKPRVTVSRKNTFKVVDSTPNEDILMERPKPGSSLLKRRDTFVVDNPPAVQIADPQKGYYLNRYRRLVEPDPEPMVKDRNQKVIPIGVAMPYNHRDDEQSDSDRRRRFAASHHSMRDEPNVRDESPPLYASTTFTRQQKSPEPDRRRSPIRRKSPEPRASTTPTKKPFRNRSSIIHIGETFRKPIESVKISFESLRKPASPQRDPSQTNLGFDRFYDPNYYVPKNQNIFGPLATAHNRQIHLQPKISDRSKWLYNNK